MKKNILITGGYGFFGQHVFDQYQNDNKYQLLRFDRKNYDLLNLYDASKLLDDADAHFKGEPFGIIHLAGWNGGIEFNRLYPADIYWQNVEMGNNLFRAVVNSKVKPTKIVSALASCAFPVKDNEIRAFEILHKAPHDSVMCHGYAKRHLEILTRLFSQQYGINATTFCPPTLFGPGDKLDVKRCKFISAVIIKMLSNPNEVTFFGDGSAYREIIYVKRAATELMKCYEEQPSAGIRNIPYICEGVNKTIKGFVKDVASVIGYEGKILWTGEVADNGQNYKSFSRPWEFNWDVGWYKEGLSETVEWYRKELSK